MKQYLLDETLFKALLEYLGTRPYKEVFQGIQGLMQLQEYITTEE